MDHDAHAPAGPDARSSSASSVLGPAAHALARIVHIYAPGQTARFQPDHWRGLQPDPYALNRVRTALAGRACLDLELTAVNIATEAIAISPFLGRATVTACGVARHSITRDEGVSWIMKAARPATGLAVLITACRLLTQASATDHQLRHQGLLNTLHVVRPA